MSRVLVTGGTGFIGSHLVEHLIERGDKVRCLVREQSNRRWLEGLPVDYCFGDIRDFDSLPLAVDGVDYVFHLAAAKSSLHENDIYQINSVGTANLLKTVIKYNPGIKRFVYISSLAAVGPSSSMLTREEDSAHPITAYGKSKLAGEKSVLSFSQKMPVTIIRPPAVYGPKDYDFLIFYRCAAKHVRLIICFKKKGVSFIYIDDLIQGIILAAGSPKAIGQVYFLVSDIHVSCQELTGLIAQAMNKKTISMYLPCPMMYLLAFIGETFHRVYGQNPLLDRQKARDLCERYWICDGSKAERDLGFKPNVCLREGIERCTAWYRETGWC